MLYLPKALLLFCVNDMRAVLVNSSRTAGNVKNCPQAMSKTVWTVTVPVGLLTWQF